jgi:hypothetical protein
VRVGLRRVRGLLLARRVWWWWWAAATRRSESGACPGRKAARADMLGAFCEEEKRGYGRHNKKHLYISIYTNKYMYKEETAALSTRLVAVECHRPAKRKARRR